MGVYRSCRCSADVSDCHLDIWNVVIFGKVPVVIGVAASGGAAVPTTAVAAQQYHLSCRCCYNSPARCHYAVLPLLLPLLEQRRQRRQHWHGGLGWGSSSRSCGSAVQQYLLLSVAASTTPPPQVNAVLPLLLPLLEQKQQRRQSWHGGLRQGISISGRCSNIKITRALLDTEKRVLLAIITYDMSF